MKKDSICILISTLFTIFILASFLSQYHKPMRSAIFMNSILKFIRLNNTFRQLNKTRPICGFPVLRAAADTDTGYLSANGTWISNSQGELDRFEPDICSYKYGPVWPINKFNVCLKKKNITRIVLMGDSNGIRYAGAFINFLEAGNYTCETVKKDKPMTFSVERSFYESSHSLVGDINSHDRDCQGCTNHYWSCQSLPEGGANYTIDIKFLVTEFTLDNEVTTLRTINTCNGRSKQPEDPHCISSLTTQEFLFREYLRASGNSPDLLIILGNSHDQQRGTLVDYRRSLRFLLELIDDYLPQSTRLVWLSKPAEYPPRKASPWNGQVFEGRFTINEWLDRANRIFYKELMGRSDKIRQPLIFYDMLALLNPVIARLSIDGVHVQPIWYKHIVSYILQTLCEDHL